MVANDNRLWRFGVRVEQFGIFSYRLSKLDELFKLISNLLIKRNELFMLSVKFIDQYLAVGF